MRIRIKIKGSDLAIHYFRLAVAFFSTAVLWPVLVAFFPPSYHLEIPSDQSIETIIHCQLPIFYCKCEYWLHFSPVRKAGFQCIGLAINLLSTSILLSQNLYRLFVKGIPKWWRWNLFPILVCPISNPIITAIKLGAPFDGFYSWRLHEARSRFKPSTPFRHTWLLAMNNCLGIKVSSYEFLFLTDLLDWYSLDIRYWLMKW